jgi:pyruvate/2-oxoglutarate dehydrogenase complex dihydrolipoamide dehydrogenase (E3) component
VDEILVVAGRLPSLEGLNLEAANVAYNKRGVEVDDTLRTTNPAIYAAGDVASRFQFTHTADATARMVLQNALFPGAKKKLSDLIVPWATYTDPEVAHVGLYDWEAEKAGIAVETYTHLLAETDRGRTDGEEGGFVKVHVKKGADKILGATIVGRHAGELISEITASPCLAASVCAICPRSFTAPIRPRRRVSPAPVPSAKWPTPTTARDSRPLSLGCSRPGSAGGGSDKSRERKITMTSSR